MISRGVPHEGDGEPVSAEACGGENPGPVAARDQAPAVAGDILRDGVPHERPAARPVLALHICVMSRVVDPSQRH